MLQFFKYVLATIAGLCIFTLLALFLIIGIGVAVSSSEKSEKITKNSVLYLNLNANFSEKTITEDPLTNILESRSIQKIGLPDLVQILKSAKTDNRISGIKIRVDNPLIGMGMLEELRLALLDFKTSGKFIYSYSETLSEKGLYISSLADTSYVTPAGSVELNGLTTESPFFSKALDKLGVKAEIFRVGRFKSAIEPFIRNDMSPENKLQTKAYLNDISKHFFTQIAKNRNVDTSTLNILMRNALVQTPQDAEKYKLITKVGYHDELNERIKTRLGKNDVTYADYEKYKANAHLNLPSGESIAVLIAEGEIESGNNDQDGIYSDSFIKDLRNLVEDDDIKAIVLRINSPGGSALASDVMWREIQLAKIKKPVIASMGDVAASGGYYMAMGCDAIIAEPTTITGSIGVFGIIPNFSNLLENKLGVTFDGVQTHPYANSPSLTRTMTEGEKKVIQNNVENIYALFIAKAAKGRNMDIDKLKEIAEGRVWTGNQSKDIGLVDQTGSLSDAVKLAASKAKIKNKELNIKYFPESKGSIEKILSNMSVAAKTWFTSDIELGIDRIYQEIKFLKSQDPIQYRLITVPEFN